MTLLAAAAATASVSAQNHLQFADYLILVGYFVLMLGIGVYFYRFMRGIKDYFSGGNNIPWWLSGVSFYMSSFSVFAFVSYSALAYKYGWVGVTLLWVAVPATIFSVTLFARKWRRARIDSPVEYLETRYSPAFRQLVAWQGIPVKMVDDGLKLVAISAFISVSLGLDKYECMFGAGIIILLYTFMGGLWAVAVTDFIQFVVMAVAVLILLPLSIDKAGGWTAFQEAAPAGFFNLTTPEYNWLYIILLSLLYCVAWSSINWPLIQRYYCVANEKEALKVGWFVTVLNVIGPPLMFIPAMAASQFLPGLADDEIYPRLCIDLLPAGILGLIIAAMFAATMSMLSSDYNVCAGVLTNDVYRRLLRPKATQRELVAVGRLMTFVVGGFALGAAFLMAGGTGEGLFKKMVTLFSVVTAPIGIPMILGLLVKRVSNFSALCGWFSGIVVGLAMLAKCPSAVVLSIPGTGLNVNLEQEVAIFLASALTTMVVMYIASFLPTGSQEKGRVNAFFERLNSPIGSLEEDRLAVAQAGKVFSPFKIVGVSIFFIGLMLLGILPWVGEGMAIWLTAGFGIALLVIGAITTWCSPKLAPIDNDNADVD